MAAFDLSKGDPMFVKEEFLSKHLAKNPPSGIFCLYGKEHFLTKMYTQKIIDKAVGKLPSDFDYARFSGNPDFDLLLNAVEGLPVIADKKVVLIQDFEFEKLDNITLENLIQMISELSDTTVLIISNISIIPDTKKAKTKKILDAISKNGIVCEFDYLSTPKIISLIEKKVKRSNCTISKENAKYLTELCLSDLSKISEETAKLCSFVGQAEITKEIIDSLVEKQVDTSVYLLASAIVEQNNVKSVTILDDLFFQRIEPIVILASLTSAFTDFYKAKVARASGISPSVAAKDFHYPQNRTFLLEKAYRTVSSMEISTLRDCLKILIDTDLQLKSVSTDNRILLEQALVKLMERVHD
jgi:DNA polymerase-3 subunit delta